MFKPMCLLPQPLHFSQTSFPLKDTHLCKELFPPSLPRATQHHPATGSSTPSGVSCSPFRRPWPHPLPRTRSCIFPGPISLEARYIHTKNASSLFSILDPTFSGDETKSPTSGSLSGTSIGTLNITPWDSLSTVTSQSSSSSFSLSLSCSFRTAPLSSSGFCPPTEVPSCPWTGSPTMKTSMSVPTRVPSPSSEDTSPEDPFPRCNLADFLTTGGPHRVPSPSSADSTRRRDPTTELFFHSGNRWNFHPLSWMNLWILTRTFLPATSHRTPSTRSASQLPSYPNGTSRCSSSLTLFNMGDDATLSTSSTSTDLLRPCIFALRGGLRPRELPLCSLKPT